MNKVNFITEVEILDSSLLTPIGIYLQIRDKYPASILLESTDFHSNEDSWSFIAIEPIAGIELIDSENIDYKFPLKDSIKQKVNHNNFLEILENFRKSFIPNNECQIPCVQGLFGYTAFDSVLYFQEIDLINKLKDSQNDVPLIRYRFYKYIIAINHFNNNLYLCENKINGICSDIEILKSILKNQQFVNYPFNTKGNEEKNISDEEFINIVNKGKEHCQRGDVFQIVLSRQFKTNFTGDDFNVYRALRNINPSPYLFYFDYIDYKIFGSSPESQLIVKNKNIIIHPIAGTFKRSGNPEIDKNGAKELLLDEKENAEHMMLVDLARNDLSIFAKKVKINYLKQIKYYSHVIHLVSEVSGELKENTPLFNLIASTFPAGTLSGAPKKKAIQLIDKYENTPRGIYGGTIGFIGFSQIINHAIIIRSFLSKNNTLYYQAGAGIVINSIDINEKNEVDNKLGALRKAIHFAKTI